MKRRWFKILLSLCGLLIGLVVAEWIIRTYHPFAIDYHLRAAYRFSCYKPGTYYWARFAPDKTCLLHSEAGAFEDVTFSFNSLGLRNRSIEQPKPENRHRVLFVGDSFIAGWGVRDDQALPQQTEIIAKQLLPDADIETINAGLAGSGLGYSYLFLKNEGMNLDPDTIVVGFYLYNDLAENMHESVWTDANRDGIPEAIRSTASYVDYQGNMRRHGRPLKMIIPFLQQSYLYDLATDQILRLIPQDYKRTSTVAMYCVFKENCHKLDEEKKQAKSLLLAMNQLATAHSGQLIVLLIPAEFQIHPDHRLQYGIPVALSPADIKAPHREFADFFEKNGIRYIDLLPTFQSSADKSLYFTLDEHWNAAGNEKAANVVADYIIDMVRDRSDVP